MGQFMYAMHDYNVRHSRMNNTLWVLKHNSHNTESIKLKALFTGNTASKHKHARTQSHTRSYNSQSTLMDRQQEEHPDCKNWVKRCWCGHLSKVKCKWFAYSPTDATATPLSPASLKSRMVLPFWYWHMHYAGCPGRKPLNGCSIL